MSKVVDRAVDVVQALGRRDGPASAEELRVADLSEPQTQRALALARGAGLIRYDRMTKCWCLTEGGKLAARKMLEA